MFEIISANELKTKGVNAIHKATVNGNEAVITIRGKQKYIVIPIEAYQKYREYELEIAIMESKKDLENGKFVKESVDEHIKRITDG